MRQSPISRRWLGTASLLLAGLGACGAARPAGADDWLQFRRDERRTAASRDRLQLPLTEVWSTSGNGTVTWRGRAFYVRPDGRRATVYCVDLRTGAPLWKRPLSFAWAPGVMGTGTGLPMPVRTPVAVTADGIVYVQDYLAGTSSMGAVGSQGVTITWGRPTRYFCRAFRAADGFPLGQVSDTPNNPPVPQTILFDGLGAPPNRPVSRQMLPFGPALIRGNELIAGTAGDCLFHWAPGNPSSLFSFAHAEPPQAGGLELRALDYGGFPPTSAGSGLVIGGMSSIEPDGVGIPDNGRQHLALVNGTQCVWHVDYPWSLGYPTVTGNSILTGAGRGGADTAIMAHDLASGAVRWVYPPNILRPDGVSRGIGGGLATGPGGVVRSFKTNYVALPHAFRSHAGIAISGGRAYGAAYGVIVALEVNTGMPVWRWKIPSGEIPRSVALSPSHVLISLDRISSKRPMAQLVALRLADGKPEWSLALPVAGDLALSEGLLFLGHDSGVHAFAPAERTYRMAVDSPNSEDYDPLPGLNREPLGEPPGSEPPPGGDAEQAARPEKAAPSKAFADATVVRLRWGEPVEQMLRQVRERQSTAPGMPLLLSLDWLDSTRTSIRGGQPGWSASEITAFAAVCERLAREVSPQHLDLAPEVDVYLTRDMRRLPAVANLLRAAQAAVKKVAPNTKTLISFNRELLARRYGEGKYLPFGKLVLLKKEEQLQLLTLLADVDEVGLTTAPQSVFNSPLEFPGDYFLSLQAVLPKKPVLLTRLAMHWDETDKTPEVTQAAYLKRVIQTAYWINAELIAYPELLAAKRTAGDKMPDVALRVDKQDRLALAYWRDTLQWKRVTRLTAAAADLEQQPR